MQWGPSDDQIAILCVIALVVSLLVIRACLPWYQSERPITPPESLYAPGGEQL